MLSRGKLWKLSWKALFGGKSRAYVFTMTIFSLALLLILLLLGGGKSGKKKKRRSSHARSRRTSKEKTVKEQKEEKRKTLQVVLALGLLALLLMGYYFLKLVVVALLGGTLVVLFVIANRQYLHDIITKNIKYCSLTDARVELVSSQTVVKVYRVRSASDPSLDFRVYRPLVDVLKRSPERMGFYYLGKTKIIVTGNCREQDVVPSSFLEYNAVYAELSPQAKGEYHKRACQIFYNMNLGMIRLLAVITSFALQPLLILPLYPEEFFAKKIFYLVFAGLGVAVLTPLFCQASKIFMYHKGHNALATLEKTQYGVANPPHVSRLEEQGIFQGKKQPYILTLRESDKKRYRYFNVFSAAETAESARIYYLEHEERSKEEAHVLLDAGKPLTEELQKKILGQREKTKTIRYNRWRWNTRFF